MDPLERNAVLLLHTIAVHATHTNTITLDHAFLLKDCFSLASQCECYEEIEIDGVVDACRLWVSDKSPDGFYDVFVPRDATRSYSETNSWMDTQANDISDSLFSEMETDNETKAWTREILGDEICDFLEEGSSTPEI